MTEQESLISTRVIKVDPDHPEEGSLREAGRIIREGGLVAFPTETVYGLGGNGLDAGASAKIYAAKGRPSDNPLILHIADPEALTDIVEEIPEAAKLLMERFWPGPLTIIFRKKDCVPYATTGGLDTVAVRMPSHRTAQMLIREAGVPIAAPSANLSGRPSPTTAEHVIRDLSGRIEMIIDSGAVGIGLESTIVDVTGERPVLLRPGYITYEMLEDLLKEVQIDPVITETKPDPNLKPKAPGMKYRHYAPKGDLVIVKGPMDAVIRAINEACEKDRAAGYTTGVLASSEAAASYHADVVSDCGSRENLEEIAHNLFAVLRDFDEQGVEKIYAECFDGEALGMAVMNRLRKAAGYHMMTVE